MKDTELRQAALDHLGLKLKNDERPFVSPFAVARGRDGGLIFIEMPDMNVQQQRLTLKAMLSRDGATAVVVVNEVYVATATTDEDKELVARLAAAGRLQDAPAHLLRDELHLMCESVDEAITVEATAVPKPGEPLGTWEHRVVHLPRPGFKRYLPERP